MAEKFSQFRDPGTGIQVFLAPVAPGGGSSGLSYLLMPVFAVLGVVRVLVAGLGWLLFRYAGYSGGLGAVLVGLGFWGVTPEVVAVSPGRKSSKPLQRAEVQKGDLVLANHASWIDHLLLLRCFPGASFVVPVVEDRTDSPASSATGSKSSGVRTPKKNAMSANTRMETPPSSSSTAATASASKRKLVGWSIVPLSLAISRTGKLPLTLTEATQAHGLEISKDLDGLTKQLRAQAGSGVGIVYPEFTTSNNRALLAFADVFPPSWSMLYRSTGRLAMGAGQPTVHVASIKYSPPTPLSVSSVYSVPHTTSILNHVAQILFTAPPTRSVALRILAQQDLPTSASHSNQSPGSSLTDTIATNISSLARLKRTNLDWNDKTHFLDLVLARSSRSKRA